MAATPNAPDERTRSITVAFLVYEGVTLFDVAGPAEVFHTANRFGARYDISLCSPDGADVTANIGIRMASGGDVEAFAPPDICVIPGADAYPDARVPPELAEAVRRLTDGARRIVSICTGAFLLAEAGLLDGRRATTHWRAAHELATRWPTTLVEPDAIFVRDGPISTSAGVSAGIDLALALVEEDQGPDLTRDVARAMVVYLQRSGGQSQFSAPLAVPLPTGPALRQIVDRVIADPAGDHTLPQLARAVNLSTRHLARLFRDELFTTPARYVESIRFDLARSLLDQGHTASRAAELAGFPSYESLRLAFARRVSMSPAAYQRRFRTSQRDLHG
ncbi:GlxA family transcriptional regulator [Microbacterium sp. A8/3-1]|uniref:GlxA family transcriptional regulator n=1 Tax=Microbacterium sp. A8/3-1 TaxID=3160749 RepID=A0AAU7W1Z9_9MICO